MLSVEQLDQVKNWLESARTVLVFFLPNAPLDHQAAALGVALSLQAAGKEVRWLSPQTPESEVELAGLAQTYTELGFQNLTISFPYRPESVDKVSYHIDDDQTRFHLVVQPQKGAQPLNTQEVAFSYTGADADLVITVGVQQLEQLQQLYEQYHQLFDDARSLSTGVALPGFGLIKLETGALSGLSEYWAGVLNQLAIDPTPEAATNLLAGIEETTQSFRSLMTTPETLETAARLLRLGARRIARQRKEVSVSPGDGTDARLSKKLATLSSTPITVTRSNGKKNGKNNFQLPGGRIPGGGGEAGRG